MIIIDNSALSFAFNVNNGIPILPFYDNVGDEELRHLTFYLKCLQESRADDIRYHNQEAFGLYKLADTQIDLSQRDYIENESNSNTHSKDYQRCEPMEIHESYSNQSSHLVSESLVSGQNQVPQQHYGHW